MPQKCKKPAESLRFHGFRCLISNCCFLLQSNLCLRNYLVFSVQVLAKCKLKKAGDSTSAQIYVNRPGATLTHNAYLDNGTLTGLTFDNYNIDNLFDSVNRNLQNIHFISTLHYR